MNIIISGEKLDLYPDLKTDLSLSISEITDITKHKAFKTSEIKVPTTEKNRRLLGDYNDIQAINSYNQTAIYKDGVIAFSGKLIIYESVESLKAGYISLQIISGNGDWATTFNDKVLHDYDFSSLNHDYDLATIQSSWSSYPAVVYPIADYGKFYGVAPTGTLTNANIGVHDLFPAVNMLEILNTIFNTEGYSTVLGTSVDIYHYYMLASNPNIFDSDVAEAAKALILNSDNRIFTGTISALTTETLSLDKDGTDFNGYTVEFNDEDYDNGDNFDISTHKYTVRESGTFEFSSLLRMFVQIDPRMDFSSGESLTITAYIKVNGVTVESNSFTVTETTQTDLIVKDKARYLEAGDVIDITTYQNSPSFINNTVHDLYVQVDVQSDETFLQCDTLTRPADGYTWDYTDFLQNLSVLDFIKGIAHAFNLLFITNPNKKEVRIVKYSEFYGSDTKDANINRLEDITTSRASVPSLSSVRFAVDGNDGLITNKEVQYTLGNGDTTTEEVENPTFAICHIAESRQITTTVPILYNYETLYQETPYRLPVQSFDWTSRIIHHNGTKAATVTIDRTAVTTIPDFDNEGIDTDGLQDNYDALMYQRNNGTVRKCNVNLNDNDISNLINNSSIFNFATLLHIDDVNYILSSASYSGKQNADVVLQKYDPSSFGVTKEVVTYVSDSAGSGGVSSGNSGGTSGGTTYSGVLTTLAGVPVTLTFEGSLSIRYCLGVDSEATEIISIKNITATGATIETLVDCVVSWEAK